MISTDLFPIPFSICHLWTMRGKCVVKEFSKNVWKCILIPIISLEGFRRKLIAIVSILCLLFFHIEHDSASDSSQAWNLLCGLGKKKKQLNTENQWVESEGKKNLPLVIFPFSMIHSPAVAAVFTCRAICRLDVLSQIPTSESERI